MSVRTQRHVLRDPKQGEVVRLPAGTFLEVRFRRRGLAPSRWQVEDRPGNLVPLVEGDHDFQFLVFSGPDLSRPLRLVRSRLDRSGPTETRDLVVVVG